MTPHQQRALRAGRKLPPMKLVHRFINEEAAIANIDPALIFNKDRRTAVSWVRARVCRRLRALNYSTPGIGQRLGIDHTTVLWAMTREVSDSPPRLTKRPVPPPLIFKPITIACVPPPVSEPHARPQPPPSEIVVPRALLMGSGRFTRARLSAGDAT